MSVDKNLSEFQINKIREAALHAGILLEAIPGFSVGVSVRNYWGARELLVNTAALPRWDEKAGLLRDAIRSQCSTCSRHKEKETGNAED